MALQGVLHSRASVVPQRRNPALWVCVPHPESHRPTDAGTQSTAFQVSDSGSWPFQLGLPVRPTRVPRPPHGIWGPLWSWLACPCFPSSTSWFFLCRSPNCLCFCSVSLLFLAQLLIGNLFSSPDPLAAYLCTCLSLVGQYAPLLRAVVPRWGPQTLTISTTVRLDLLEMGNAEALPHASRIMKSGSWAQQAVFILALHVILAGVKVENRWLRTSVFRL